MINSLGHIISKNSQLAQQTISSEIVSAYGTIAGERINRLIDLKLIEENKRGMLVRTNKNIDLKTEKIQKLSLELNSDYVRPSNFGKNKNVSYTFQESLLPDDAKDINHEIEEFFRYIHSKMEMKKSDKIKAQPYYFNFTGERLFFKSESQNDLNINNKDDN